MRCHAGNSKLQTPKFKETSNLKLQLADARADVSGRAPFIDPVAHAHHPAGKGGSLCIDCHMPQTTYMHGMRGMIMGLRFLIRC